MARVKSTQDIQTHRIQAYIHAFLFNNGFDLFDLKYVRVGEDYKQLKVDINLLETPACEKCRRYITWDGPMSAGSGG